MTQEVFNTKIAIVLEENLQQWQKLNVSAFLGSAIAGHFPETLGPDFVDKSETKYLGIFRHPVLIFGTTSEKIREIYAAAKKRGLHIGIYTRPIFKTQGEENLTAIKALTEEEQDMVGLVLYGPKGLVDKSLGGVKLHS